MPLTNPFLDPDQVRGGLYAGPDRLASRTHALLRARVSGTPVVDVLSRLLDTWLTVPVRDARLLDAGCGRGTTSRALAGLGPASLVALDLSPGLAATARSRLPHGGQRAVVSADFHRLPFRSNVFDAAIAAFCLYHSSDPTAAIREISRCLNTRGAFIAVTKSEDSYSELDEVIADIGMASDIADHPSLYTAAHSGNILTLTAPVLKVRQVLHEEHRFRFETLEHLASYLVTTPKYVFADNIGFDHQSLAEELRRRGCPTPLVASSTVSYLVGVPDA
ncbi:class I SAM-dependent methyltransferase [Nocardiopsis sp. NPDC049922]|uniref:class I SAM-dependent methyltransferase n=1 Tax=Nocardiopsis sp. NPDC049922 TaxID=3155157 RepID=UPI0033C3AB19